MSNQAENNKRIAKNTIMLYIRMLITMGVTLYTSRVVLESLGVENYGIYNVVGGVVAMFSFINSSMSGATSRFITYEIGRGDIDKLKDTFSASLTIHIIIALIVLVLGETIGLWFVENKLVLPADRMNAARIIYQLSIATVMLSITQVPYNATIISYERMNVFAYVEIINASLKLGAALLVSALAVSDKLILYGGLILAVSASVMFIYRAYSIKFFSICRYRFKWDWSIIKPMLHFSGWDLYGNASVVARIQGVNMLLNIFFGPVLNAASAVAIQVQSATASLTGNIILAFRPQIVKSFSQKDYKRTCELVEHATKFSFILQLVLIIPLLIEMPFVLSFWLKEVPEFAIIFCRYSLIIAFFSNFSNAVTSAIHATGNIKQISIVSGTMYFLVVPLSYVAYRQGVGPWASYFVNSCMILLGSLYNIYILTRQLNGFHFFTFIKNALAPCLIIGIIIFIVSHSLSLFIPNKWIQFFSTMISSTLLIIIFSYKIILNKKNRPVFIAKIKSITTKKILVKLSSN